MASIGLSEAARLAGKNQSTIHRAMRTRLNRAKLKGAVATKAKAKFNADVNAILSRDNGGLTIHQLADGVPLEEWWETGLSPEQAAVRCLDWRTKSTMLPPDEVEPGEEFERAASPE